MIQHRQRIADNRSTDQKGSEGTLIAPNCEHVIPGQKLTSKAERYLLIKDLIGDLTTSNSSITLTTSFLSDPEGIFLCSRKGFKRPKLAREDERSVVWAVIIVEA